MSEMDWVALIAAMELGALATLGLGALVWFLIRRRRRDYEAVAELARRIRAGRQAHHTNLSQLLCEHRGLEPGEGLAEATRLVEAETGFYDYFLKTYLNRDTEAVLLMDHRLQAVIAPYRDLACQPPEAPAPESVEAGDPEEASEEGATPQAGGASVLQVRRLAERLEHANEDLERHRDTLNLVFREYTAMFGVQINRGEELSAEEILERLRSGKLDGGAADDDGDATDPDEIDAITAREAQSGPA